jgi:hypothetical protein
MVWSQHVGRALLEGLLGPCNSHHILDIIHVNIGIYGIIHVIKYIKG